MRPIAFPVLALLMLLTISLASHQPAMSWTPRIERVDTPAGADSGQPQLSSSDAGIVLSWIERAGPTATLRFAERSRGGWSVPRTVASGDNWFVNWADVPSVVRLASGEFAAHWLQKSGSGTYAYDVRVSHSADGGRTWSPSVTPHSDGTKTEHGFASLFEMPGAGLGLAWLDGRAMSPGAHAGHAGPDAGAMSLRFATFGRDWKQTAEIVLDSRVCECCPTSAVVTADGPIVAYRNRSEDEVRDIHVSRLENGRWSESRPVHADGWRIAACPVNGPALSARGREVAVAWFAAPGDRPHAFISFSHDAGRSFGSPIRLDDVSTLGRVDVELTGDGAAVASWIEVADGRAQLRVRRVQKSGERSRSMTVAGLDGGRASGYPRIARHGDELVFAWTETADGRSQVRTAVAHAR